MWRASVFLLGAALAAAQGRSGDLLESARAGKTKQLEALIPRGADLEARDKEGRTPLMLAAQYGRVAAVQLLLSKGARADARDAHGWNAYMLALLAPSGGVIHTTHDTVLKLLPQPPRFRLAVNAAWSAENSELHSCFLRPDELTRHLRELRPDVLAIEAFQRFAIASGRDLIAIVQSDALGTSEVPNMSPSRDIDATLFLMVEPGVACVYQADQVSLAIHATLVRPGEPAPKLEKTFSAGAATGMRGEVAANPNQYGALFAAWAKSQAASVYWAVVAALMEER